MKVLYIVGGSGKKYGSEIIAMSILESLALAKGVEYTVVTSKGGCVNEFCKTLAIENYVVSLRPYVYYEGTFFLAGKGKRIIRNIQADYAAEHALKKLEKLVRLEEYDLIHTNLSRDLLGGMIKEKYKIPHIWHIQEMYEGHYGLKLLKRNQIEWMNQRTDAYIAISEHVADGWVSHGLDREKVNIILNGIDLSNINEKNWNQKRGVVRIVMAGELCEPKGQIYLLEALNIIRRNGSLDMEIKVDLYGEGKADYIDFLKNKTAEYHLQGMINFKGYFDNMQSILSNYEIAVNCSRGEGFGLFTVEAMACGLCVLAADTGANTELIKDQANGVIFQYENAAKELSAAICELAGSPDTMMKLGMRASADVRERYNLANMCEQVFQLYRKVIR